MQRVMRAGSSWEWPYMSGVLFAATRCRIGRQVAGPRRRAPGASAVSLHGDAAGLRAEAPAADRRTGRAPANPRGVLHRVHVEKRCAVDEPRSGRLAGTAEPQSTTTCARLSAGRRNTTCSSGSVSPGRWGDSGTCRDTGAKGGGGWRVCWSAKVHTSTQAGE